MAENQFDYLKNEWPARHIFFYNDRILTDSITTADCHIALEQLIANELDVEDETIQNWLPVKKFTEDVRFLQHADLEDKDRIEREYYAAAPLLLLWPHIRDTRTIDDARQWLTQAIDTIMSVAEPHLDEGCGLDEFNDDTERFCRLSPICPYHTSGHALLDTVWDEGVDILDTVEGPGSLRKRLEMQLHIAVKQGLITPTHSSELLCEFDKRK